MNILLWVAAGLCLVGAVMLVAGVGAPGLWIAVITAGIVIVVVGRVRRGT